MTEYWWYF